eukprot:496616-Pyramimonas_sp.AAC.1
MPGTAIPSSPRKFGRGISRDARSGPPLAVCIARGVRMLAGTDDGGSDPRTPSWWRTTVKQSGKTGCSW